jgi:DNA polymerase-3 subunit alpha
LGDIPAAVIRRIAERRGIAPDLHEIPFDDPPTYALFASGDTEGVPRFDHEESLDLLRALAPDRFAHLVAFQALNRMSTLTSGLTARYVERRHGREPSSCEIPALSPILSESHGLLLYEEQVGRVAEAVANLDAPTAARFARAWSRFDETGMSETATTFLEGAAGGWGKPAAEGVLAWLRGNAAFTLSRARLAAFAEEGYRVAWLKANYRSEFEAALGG